MIVFQESKSLATHDLAGNLAEFRTRLDDLVTQPLMVTFSVVMRKEFVDRISQRLLAEEYHPILIGRKNLSRSVLQFGLCGGRSGLDAGGFQDGLNLTDSMEGALATPIRYVLMDRDTKFTAQFAKRRR